MPNFDDGVPYEASGKPIPALERLAGNNDSTCRLCDGSGFFYGDADLGPCVCVNAPLYGYWLHPESNSGGIYRSSAEKHRIIGNQVEEVSFEEYRKARDAGWEVEWTENEEL